MGKLKKEKHNHKLTDFLKVGIFSLVMLAPFISIGSKMAYVTFNKNAKDSYYGETINETVYTPLTNTTKLNIHEEYNFNANQLEPQNYTTGKIEVNGIYNFEGTYNLSHLEDINGFYIGYNNSIPSNILTFTFNSYSSVYIGLVSNNISFDFYVDGISALTNWDIFINNISSISYNNNSYLDNVFEYAVNQLGETQIFAWTKNTAIYTPIERMTNGLGFDPENNTLAILITYWSLVTAVYVIIDIVLFAFTKITHFTQD